MKISTNSAAFFRIIFIIFSKNFKIFNFFLKRMFSFIFLNTFLLKTLKYLLHWSKKMHLFKFSDVYSVSNFFYVYIVSKWISHVYSVSYNQYLPLILVDISRYLSISHFFQHISLYASISVDISNCFS